MGSVANFKLKGKKAKAVFTFEVRDYNEARTFRARGVDQCTPAFRLRDITDYETKEMVKIFGKDATPWQDIWMPMDPTYVRTRHETWQVLPKQRRLAVMQKDVYCLRAPQDSAPGCWRIVALHSHFCDRCEKEGGEGDVAG